MSCREDVSGPSDVSAGAPEKLPRRITALAWIIVSTTLQAKLGFGVDVVEAVGVTAACRWSARG
jgi:hypothetical protein